MWLRFTEEFCKVAIVCYDGNPNWLGWMAMAAAAFFIACVALWLIGTFAY